MARRLVGWWCVGLALNVGACRTHDALCEGFECAPTPSDGGAPSSPPEGNGGEGMAGGAEGPGAAEPACSSDQQCQNDSTCDGEEVCTARGCEPGPKHVCEHGTTCDDDAPELCVYEDPSPWLLATAAGSVVALPTRQLGLEQAFTIAANPETGALEGFSNIYWSPDGNVAIFHVREEELGTSFHIARFQAGLPSQVSLLPGVPNFTLVPSTPEFSGDSAYVFIYDSVSGTYLIDLKDPAAPARHIPTTDEGAHVETSFCADGRTWFAWAETFGQDQTWIGTVDDRGSITHIESGSIFDFSISSDRRLLLIDRGTDEEGNKLGLVLRPCSSEPWSVDVEGDYYQFSPDSKRLWIESVEPFEFEGAQKVLSLEEPASPVELVSSEALGATLTTTFSPDGQYLEASVDGLPHLVSLSVGASQPLIPLPDTAAIAVLGSVALLGWSSDEATPDTLVWHAVPPSGPAVPLLENVTVGNSRFITDTQNPERVFLVRALDDTTELFSLLLDGVTPVAKLLLTIAGPIATVTATPADAGILFTRTGHAPDDTLMFAPFEPAGTLGTPALVVEGPWSYEIQPWS